MKFIVAAASHCARLPLLLFMPLLFLLPLFCACGVQPGPKEFPVLTGDYLGQKAPGAEPEIFAPGIVSTGLQTRDLTMTPDGDELYFGVVVGNFTYTTVLCTKRVDGRWTKPEVPAFAADLNKKVAEPFIAPDGQRFFFISDRAHGDKAAGDHDIWVMDRVAGDWGEPHPLPVSVNSEQHEFYPTVTRDNTLYFCRREADARVEHVYRSRLEDGEYRDCERLPDNVNAGRARFNVTISPNEDFIILPCFGLPDSHGATDYYISFRDDDDNWTEALNMGPTMNTAGGMEYSANLSPDGKYLFFMSARLSTEDAPRNYGEMLALQTSPYNGLPKIWWVDASFINELRAQAMGGK